MSNNIFNVLLLAEIFMLVLLLTIIKIASEPVKEKSCFVSYIGYIDTTSPHLVCRYGATVFGMKVKTGADLDSVMARIKKNNGFQQVVPLAITPMP